MIENFIEKIEILENVSLKKYNTYRLDLKCKYLVFPKNIDELKEVLEFIKKNKYKYLVLGNGSNVIFNCDYYDGVIIKLDKFNKITFNDNIVKVDSGVSLAKLAISCINKSLSGLEFACGIPGLVGASAVVNAGAYKSDMASIVKEVKLLTPKGEIIILNNLDLKYSYRSSILKNSNYIVLEVTLELSKGDKLEMLEIVNRRREKRISTQPLEYPSAGSVFRNPEGMYAGELIEKCNLKGYNINGAEVSQKHANFIINKGHATGKDIVELINIIKKKVKEKYNVDLILEQIIIE